MKIPIYKRIWFKLTLTLVLGLSLAFYISYYFTTQYSNKIITSHTQKEFNTAIKVINNFIRVVGETSQVWAKHTVIDNRLDKLAIKGPSEALRNQLRIDKDAVSADTILLLDKESTIIGNVGSVQMMGNTLKRNALVKVTLETQSAQTMILRENESFIIYSSYPIYHNSIYEGMILLGYFINDAFLDTIKKNIDLDIAFVGNSAIMSSSNWAGEGTLDVLPIPFIRYQILLQDEKNLTTIEHNDQEFIVSARKLSHLDPAISGSILVGVPSESYNNIKLDILEKAGAFFGALFLISMLAVLLITRRSTKAILNLNDATNAVSDGKLDVKIDLKSGDELALLGKNFNDMVENIKNKDAIIKEHTANLESKVEKRTLQLKKVNNQLEYQNNELEASNKSFEQLINATIEAIVVLKDGKIVDANTSALELFKIQAKENLLGLLIDDFVSNKSLHIVKEHTSLDKTEPYEIIMQNGSGDEFFVLIKEQNLQKAKGHVRIMTIMDLTELKTKDKLIAAQAKMSAMGEMIENIAHQWRQPLSVITTSASSISAYKRFGKLNDEVLERSVNTILNTSNYLSSTIDDFRNFFKSDKIKEQFNIAEVMESNLALVHANLRQSNINVHTNLDRNLDFSGYKNEFIQAVLNILNNAKDAMKNIESSDDKHLFVDAYEDKKSILIRIKDSGGGIDLGIIDKVFEPYFTTKHQSHGTGLGLYITHQIIVLNMGGKLNVKNVKYDIGKNTFTGAEFTITLPKGK